MRPYGRTLYAQKEAIFLCKRREKEERGKQAGKELIKKQGDLLMVVSELIEPILKEELGGNEEKLREFFMGVELISCAQCTSIWTYKKVPVT